MRDPVGILRNLFLRLYGTCFDVEILEHDRSLVVLRDKNETGKNEFMFLMSEPREIIVERYFHEREDATVQFGMMFCRPWTTTTVTWKKPDGHVVKRESTRRYLINIDGIRQGFYQTILNPRNSPRDALAVTEELGIALAAHEIRHELQLTGLIPKEQWYTSLPEFREQRVTATRTYSKVGIASEYHSFLKRYGKRLVDAKDRELLAMELDAISVQLRSSYAWTDSRHLPLEERLKFIRDIIFSVAQ